MASAKFYLRDPKAKKKTSICLDFSYDGYRLQCSTKLSINPKDWSHRQNWPKHQISSYSQYNSALLRIQSIVEDFYLDNKKTGSTPSTQSIKDHLSSQLNKKEEKTIGLWEIYDTFINHKSQKVKELTVKKFITLKKLLEGFSKDKNHQLDFNKFDSKFEMAFCSYLTCDLQQVNNTVSKYITCLKVFLKWAQEEGYHQNLSYQKFTSKSTDKEITYLTEKELKKLFNLDLINSPRLSRTRDMFLFQCFTGQRFSDIENLKWGDIQEVDGDHEWHLYQKKGDKPKMINVPLIISEATQILFRQNRGALNDKIFSPISNQKLNVYIKELCQMAEIDSHFKEVKYRGKERIEITGQKHEFISTHTARRTFITLALERGMRPEVLQKITGHEDYRTMKKYIAVTDKVKKAEMRKAFAEGSFLS